MSENDDRIRDQIRKRYGSIASTGEAGCGCSTSCCSTPRPPAEEQSAQLGYSASELGALPEGANLGLGCGNPQALAILQPGEVVLDLGSGGGIDCFLASKRVGDRGKVIGVDMTPEMISKARANARKANFPNVEFRLGEIEHLPAADNSVDVVMSNCVINLSADKQQVYQEAYRVLKPGGRLAISDVVAIRELPQTVKNDLEKYSGCVAGAAAVGDIERMLRAAGFQEIRIDLKQESKSFIKNWFPDTDLENYILAAEMRARK
jgi:arsenite methyltransferase